MCFSAEASFALAAALTSAAAFTVSRTWRGDRRWLGLALFPAGFAVQQAAEGALWLALDTGDAAGAALASRGFLFFSHVFWLAWVPFSTFLIEPDPRRRRILGWLTVAGAAFGASIGGPSLALSDWLSVEVVQGSIEYHTTLIWDGVLGRTPLRAIYAAIILAALFVSSHRSMAAFGGLILASLAFTLWLRPFAFISVWCFFAAILSLYMAGLFWRRPAALTARP
jgi:hypothetical protein